MDNNDKSEFESVMLTLGEVYGREISATTLKIYWKSFCALQISEFRDACNRHLVNPEFGRFFPKPADISRELSCNRDRPDVEDQAYLAWLEVKNQIRVCGIYGTLDIPDKLAIACVRELGGWQKLCRTDVDKMQWAEREFINCYRAISKIPRLDLPDRLAGIVDDNANRISHSRDFSEVVGRISSRG